MIQAWLVLGLVAGAAGYVRLVETDYVQLLDKDDQRTLNSSTRNRLVFDDVTNYLYVLAKEPARLTVFSMAEDGILTERANHKFAANLGEPLDIEFCSPATGSRRMAISFNAVENPSANGWVRVYNPLTSGNLNLVEIDSAGVGSQPVDLEFAGIDCDLLLVACTGRPHVDGVTGTLTDPDGQLDILYFSQSGNIQSSSSNNFDITSDQLPDLEANYFRSYPKISPDGNSVPVRQTIEPVSVISAPNNLTYYLAAPKNNAIIRFIFDTQSAQILPSGRRSWATYYMDASKSDGVVHMENYPIYSSLMPRQMKWVTQGPNNYLITLDTGFLDSMPEYSFYDWIKASDLANNPGGVSLDETLLEKMRNDTRLGEASVSSVDGRGPDGTISELFMFGGRGITIHDGQTMEIRTALVDNIERASAQSYKNVFHTAMVDPSHTPQQDREATSPSLGPNLSVMETGVFQDNKLLFLGSGTSGMIYIYVLVPDVECPQPFFHSVYRRGGVSSSWQQLYATSNIGDVGITDMLYIGQSEDLKPTLVVASATSNSVSTYNVVDEPEDFRRK